MHLTNYSINKHNENFDRDDSDDSGSKRYNTTTLLYNKHITVHAFGFPQHFFNTSEMCEFSLISIYLQDPSPSFVIVCKQKPIRVSGVSQCPLLIEWGIFYFLPSPTILWYSLLQHSVHQWTTFFFFIYLKSFNWITAWIVFPDP